MKSISEIAASAGNILIEAIKAPFKLIGHCFGRVVKAISSAFNYLSGRSDNPEQSQVPNKTLDSRTVSTDTVSTEQLEDDVLENLHTSFTNCLNLYLNLLEELKIKAYYIFIAKNIISSNLKVDPAKIKRKNIDKDIIILKAVNNTLDLGFSDKFFDIPPDSQPNNVEFINILKEFKQPLESLIHTTRPRKYQLYDSVKPIDYLRSKINQLIATKSADKDKWQLCGHQLKNRFEFDAPYFRDICNLKYVPEPGGKAPKADIGHFNELDAQLRTLFNTVDNL
ncbi:hypothetical protein ACTL6P_14420 [Endozoicomonas acroporae]|uniref:hypothetical protein n=1 Tax=Endozoicomonas acroporae TaxID=1701104 RepID=UPI000C779288|nr:hypothetical protein [Endozoicomonas acroporae]